MSKTSLLSSFDLLLGPFHDLGRISLPVSAVAVCIGHFFVTPRPTTFMSRIKFLAHFRLGFLLEILVDLFIIVRGTAPNANSFVVATSQVTILEGLSNECRGLRRCVSILRSCALEEVNVHLHHLPFRS